LQLLYKLLPHRSDKVGNCRYWNVVCIKTESVKHRSIRSDRPSFRKGLLWRSS